MDSVFHSAVHDHLDAFERFLRIDRERGVRTIAAYRECLEDFARNLASAGRVATTEAISRADCLAFLRSPSRSRPSDDVSPSIWNTRVSALRAFYSYLLEEELVVKNPTERITYRRVKSAKKVPLNLDSFLDVVDAAEQSSRALRARNVAIAQTLFHTALRVSELASLDEAQIDWTRYEFVNVRMKGGKLECVKFPDILAAALERYLKDSQRRRTETETALFTTRAGDRLSVRAVQQLVSELGKRAKITRPVHPHLLRHSVATEHANEGGADLRIVADILHHEKTSTTETYVHAVGGADRAAIEALGATVARRMRARHRAQRQGGSASTPAPMSP
jgi:integrase/recombinase XerC